MTGKDVNSLGVTIVLTERVPASKSYPSQLPCFKVDDQYENKHTTLFVSKPSSRT